MLGTNEHHEGGDHWRKQKKSKGKGRKGRGRKEGVGRNDRLGRREGGKE
jgi:hypothetical protein